MSEPGNQGVIATIFPHAEERSQGMCYIFKHNIQDLAFDLCFTTTPSLFNYD